MVLVEGRFERVADDALSSCLVHTRLGWAGEQVDAEVAEPREFGEVGVEGRQHGIVMDADGGDEQIDGWHAQPGVAGFGRKIGGRVPEGGGSVQERHRREPAQEWRALPARCATEQFEAHLLAEQRILCMNGLVGDLPRRL